MSRRNAHLGQSGRLMLLDIGCHSARPPSPIGSWSPYQFLPRPPLSLLPDTLFAQVDSDTVLNDPSRPPFSAVMAVDCVIESESGGACRELEVEAATWVHSGWEGAGS